MEMNFTSVQVLQSYFAGTKIRKYENILFLYRAWMSILYLPLYNLITNYICILQGGQNGSVVINGTTYTQSMVSRDGLSNGYVNPDVIPTNPGSMTMSGVTHDQSVESVQNRLNSSTASERLQQSSETEIISPNAQPKNR